MSEVVSSLVLSLVIFCIFIQLKQLKKMFNKLINCNLNKLFNKLIKRSINRNYNQLKYKSDSFNEENKTYFVTTPIFYVNSGLFLS